MGMKQISDGNWPEQTATSARLARKSARRVSPAHTDKSSALFSADARKEYA
jgi:hypothetical protein